MTKLSDILTIGDKAVAFTRDLDWLQSLATIGEQWTALAAKLNNLAEGETIDSIESLLAFLRGKLENDLVVEAFDALGLAELRTKLLASTEVYDQLPEAAKLLAAPLAAFAETESASAEDAPQPLGFRDDWVDGADPGKVSLPLSLLREEAAGTTGKVDFNLALSADVELSCEAGALWPYRRDAVTPGLLQLTLGGRLEAKAGGKLPFSSGSLSADVAAGGAAELMYFVRPADTNAIYASEVLRALPDLPSPFALRPVWNAMATTRLEGVIVAIDGYVDTDLALSFGRDIDLPKVLAGKLGITVKTSFKRKAAYVLSVRSIGSAALGKQRLLIALSRNKSAANNWGVGLGLELDLAPLVGRIHAVLDEALGEWSSELDRIRPFLNPGTWIRTKLATELSNLASKLIKDPALRDGLTADLGVLLGTSDADASALEELLFAKAADKLGEVAGLATGLAQDKASEAVAGIVAALPTLAQDGARELLSDAVGKIVGLFQTAVNETIEDVSTKAKPKDVGKALQAIGVEIGKKVEKADDAAAGLRALIERFDGLLRRAVEKTGESAMRKIGVQLSLDEQLETGLEMEVVGMIDACTPEAEALYGQLLRGKLSGLQTLFDDGRTVPGFTLDRDRSSIRRFSRASTKLGFAFVGFGLEISAFELLASEAEIRLVGNGDIVVFARGELTKEVNGPREGRTLTFVSTLDLMLARVAAMDSDLHRTRTTQAITVGIVASHRDKSLKAGEVTGYLTGLADAGLVRRDRVDKAGAIYESWVPSSGSDAKHPAGDITVAMTLGSTDLQQLLELGRALQAELKTKDAFPETTQVFAAGLDAMVRTGRLKESSLLAELADAGDAGFFSTKQKEADRALLFGYLQSERRQAGVPVARRDGRIANGPRDVGPPMANLINAMLALEGLANLLQLMAEIYDADPADIAGKGGWTEKDYRRSEALLAASSREWLKLNREWIVWFKDSISRPTQAFLLSLIALSSNQSVTAVAEAQLGDPHFHITMTPQFGEKSQQDRVSL
ncbi:hypothetical protein CHU93_02095 [Sandarakinorhabdus cyanobacteriorum]|uniref:Uncharacterized protein n=1 Tax=Sandarakinorhabdus cyanobacteriorum TaxID=1981098 RepID=A0A255Z011_9SPHN|nr:hypothetical protein [Sandarakinorhabdus cyanobacteriorum]OYQ34759.1 hypothetical protein CHU93_02095 [Sandarakinorhabdus cyanobacteriorum]